MTPDRTTRVVGAVRWALVLASALVALGAWASYLRAAGSDPHGAHAPRYQCPMHPAVVSDRPGECPICGMDLEPIDSSRAAAPAASAPVEVDPHLPDGGTAAFYCPMHLDVKSVEPGRCPICKMKLEPIPTAAHGQSPTGVAPLTLALDRMQAIGVRTAVATARPLAPVVRATATVASPEQGVAEVHVRAPGFVERIGVRETGVRVRAGQELLALYSPEIHQAQAELVASRALGAPALDAGLLDLDRVGAAARSKLELLGMDRRSIEAVASSGKPMRAVPVTAPASGWVTKKNVVLGSYVTPETTLYEIVDLSKVYVVADVSTEEMADVRVGSKARFAVTGRPELEASGAIDLVYPRTNPEARTTRVRMQIKNERNDFLPGQYGILEVAREAAQAIFVPRDAIVDTGSQRYVFVDQGEGRLAPRLVSTLTGDGDEVAISEGLSAGERVVSGATFLVDSESRLRAALAAPAPADAGATPHRGH